MLHASTAVCFQHVHDESMQLAYTQHVPAMHVSPFAMRNQKLHAFRLVANMLVSLSAKLTTRTPLAPSTDRSFHDSAGDSSAEKYRLGGSIY